MFLPAHSGTTAVFILMISLCFPLHFETRVLYNSLTKTERERGLKLNQRNAYLPNPSKVLGTYHVSKRIRT